MRALRPAALFGLCLGLVTACPGTGSLPDGGTAIDGGPDEVAGCPGDFDLSLTPTSPAGLRGPHGLQGSVQVPPTVTAGQPVQLTVVRTSGGGSFAGPAGRTTGAAAMTYRVQGLAAGAYRVRLRADQNGNGQLDDVGDLDGWYDGGVDAPIASLAAAATVVLDGGCVTGVDFGAGARP
jgi:hypothetical protein